MKNSKIFKTYEIFGHARGSKVMHNMGILLASNGTEAMRIGNNIHNRGLEPYIITKVREVKK